MFQQFDVGALAGLFEKRLEDGGAGGVGSMDDAAVAVATLAGQVELEAAVVAPRVFITGKRDALIDQPLDGLAAVLDGETHGLFIA